MCRESTCSTGSQPYCMHLPYHRGLSIRQAGNVVHPFVLGRRHSSRFACVKKSEPIGNKQADVHRVVWSIMRRSRRGCTCALSLNARNSYTSDHGSWTHASAWANRLMRSCTGLSVILQSLIGPVRTESAEPRALYWLVDFGECDCQLQAVHIIEPYARLYIAISACNRWMVNPGGKFRSLNLLG